MIFQNIQGNSNFAKDDKLRKFSKWLVTEGVGIALTAEMNTYWPTIPKGQRWRDILREASPKGHFSSVAWNSKQPRSSNSACQHGGCAVTLLGQTAHSARTSGMDKTGLGRWAWCRMQGRSRKTRALARDDPETRLPSQDLIVVSAYRPCSAGRGKNSVWAQHRDFLLSIGREEDPREAFVIDLLEAIETWQGWGCKILLGMDANEDLSRVSASSLRYRLKHAGLTEVIQERHWDSPPRHAYR